MITQAAGEGTTYAESELLAKLNVTSPTWTGKVASGLTVTVNVMRIDATLQYARVCIADERSHDAHAHVQADVVDPEVQADDGNAHDAITKERAQHARAHFQADDVHPDVEAYDGIVHDAIADEYSHDAIADVQADIVDPDVEADIEANNVVADLDADLRPNEKTE